MKYITIFIISVLVGLALVSTSFAADCPKLLISPVTFGMQNANVKTLQTFLLSQGFDIPAGPTGYYGTQTRTAVNEFQLKYSFQILYPLRLSTPTGNVYNATLTQINALFCAMI